MNKRMYINAEKSLEFICGVNEHQAAALYSDDHFDLRKVWGESPSVYDIYNADIGLNLTSEIAQRYTAFIVFGNPIFIAPFEKFKPNLELKHGVVVTNGMITNGIIQYFIKEKNYPSAIIGTSCEDYALELVKKHIPQLKIFVSTVGFQPHENIFVTRWGYILQEADNLKESNIIELDEKIAYAVIKYSRSYSYAIIRDGISIEIKYCLPTMKNVKLDYPDAVIATDYPFKHSEEFVNSINAKTLIFPETYYEDVKISENVKLLKFNHFRI